MIGKHSRIRWTVAGLVMLASHPVQAAATVYECVVEGHRTFSDQPCAPNAQSREIPESNRMVAQDTSNLSRNDSGVASKRRAASDDEQSDTDKKKVACNKIREQQEQVRAQQRAGYTAKQGEHLRVRQNKLAEQYAEKKCERYR